MLGEGDELLVAAASGCLVASLLLPQAVSASDAVASTAAVCQARARVGANHGASVIGLSLRGAPTSQGLAACF